jgi:hypothetical protein
MSEEKITVRRLKFEEADHIIDNVYLGSECSAINYEYLKTNKIDRILITAAFCDKHLEDKSGL